MSIMTTMRTRFQDARQNDSGITLVELLVSIILFGLVSTMVLSLYVGATRTVSMSSATHNNTQTAANIMNEVTRALSMASANPLAGGTQAPAFISATNESMSVLSYVNSNALNPAPVRVEFSINSSRNLVEKRYAAKVGANGLWVFDTTNTLISSRTLPGTIAASSTPFVFTYYKADRVTPTTDLALIGAVKVTLTVKSPDNPTSTGITIENFVGLPNLSFETGKS